MSRLRPQPPSSLDGAQRELYNNITGGARARGARHFDLIDDDGALQGPFAAMLLSPALGTALQELGSAVRFRAGLSARTREIAILTVAAHWDSAFERSAHESIGRAAGLTEAELSQLRTNAVPALSDPHESACANLAKAMAEGDIDDESWSTHAAIVGAATVFELSTLVGYYTTLALQMRVFRVD